MMAPRLKLIRDGYKLEKSLAGETTFAVTFTLSVRVPTPHLRQKPLSVASEDVRFL